MNRIHAHRYSAFLMLIPVVMLIILVFSSVQIGAASKTNLDPNASNLIYLPIISSNQATSDKQTWSMLGANPERTSWVSDEVSDRLKPLWYKQFEPYILPKVQIITAYSTLYISTSNGLYALDADTGTEKWVYPTELPLGHSPTVDNGIVYVGGFDRMLHAIDAYTGQRKWTFTAGAGFDTNPLVVDGLVMLGNRDGYFYAIHSKGEQTGQLAWKYQTGGPIDFSAAYKDGVVYFASEDSFAYALQAQNGDLVWKSDKLLGAGFRAWWPVVYEDWVIFTGSLNYRSIVVPGDVPESESEDVLLFPNHVEDPQGTLIGPLGTESGDWAQNTPTINTSQPEVTENGSTYPITEYLEQYSYRRTYFVLNKYTGAEYTTDFDEDGKLEYAPIMWFGTNSQNSYPPVVGIDNVLYQANKYMSALYPAGGQVTGWKIGTPYISIVSSDWSQDDEPMAYSAGGNLIYWNLCCDRESGAFNISSPNTMFSDRYNAGERPPTGIDPNREWKYFDYNLDELLPGYSMYYNGTSDTVFSAFGNRNGVYGYHGIQNPPIPYNGKVYMHRGNNIIAFAPEADQPIQLPIAKIVQYQDPAMQPPSLETLKSSLVQEVQKIIDAGHLRPGYAGSGNLDTASKKCGADLMDYWHNPGDTLYTLIQALPYLPDALQQQTLDYVQTEFINFPPYDYDHIGWKDGAARETFIVPPEVEADMLTFGPGTYHYGFDGWQLAPNSFYALWKYALTFDGTAQDIYNASKDQLEAVPSDDFLIQNPHVNNAYIAGYLGFLELEKLAGYPESPGVRDTYNRILALRASSFSKDNPDLWFQDYSFYYCRSFSVSMNFMNMVPELGQYLQDNALDKVSQALEEYTYLAPYWFEAKPETAFGEGVSQHLYDYPTIFAAKAMILQEPYPELAKYIDVPATSVGDLFYIQNLVLTIEAGSR